MTEKELKKILDQIKPLDRVFFEKAQAHLDNLTKPKGSLGRLEEIAARVVAITEKLRPQAARKRIYVFAGDHGVEEEGISCFPREVTAQMVFNFLRGGAGINVLARQVGAEVLVVDVGVDHDFQGISGLFDRKIARGTRNLARGPAMSRKQAIQSLAVGIELAREAHRDGVNLLGCGDMGIANTTPSSAITAVMTGESLEKITGKGTGIDPERWRKKVRIIRQAIRKNRPNRNDPVDVLAKVGGFEIGGIAGLILGAASLRIPVVIDGFISGAGALIAAGLSPRVGEYIFASHQSVEPGHRAILKALRQKPILELDLRLGEGTGAALGIGIVEAAVRVLNEMAAFGEVSVSREVNQSIEK
ncbi:MAG: nicotinate-nucleotide--dimethylbenzimidazole phosphoribosyltransferase [Proteobacteria bacterium]|nr:nicotinate-nucleotide--dimethylbenzimidazole phosphoribosyltransferase [Pseudomonadota bacterium]